VVPDPLEAVGRLVALVNLRALVDLGLALLAELLMLPLLLVLAAFVLLGAEHHTTLDIPLELDHSPFPQAAVLSLLLPVLVFPCHPSVLGPPLTPPFLRELACLLCPLAVSHLGHLLASLRAQVVQDQPVVLEVRHLLAALAAPYQLALLPLLADVSTISFSSRRL
jgi:hypothetical protein